MQVYIHLIHTSSNNQPPRTGKQQQQQQQQQMQEAEETGDERERETGGYLKGGKLPLGSYRRLSVKEDSRGRAKHLGG